MICKNLFCVDRVSESVKIDVICNCVFVFYRETPLRQAVRGGRKDMAELLLSKGADPNKVDNNGYVVHTMVSHLLSFDIQSIQLNTIVMQVSSLPVRCIYQLQS